MKGSQTIPEYSYCLKIAQVAHYGQFRKFSTPDEEYIHHPIRVSMDFGDEKMRCIAILHDVLEDSNFTAEMLLTLGVPDEVVSVVQVLTRKDGEPYTEYLNRVMENRDAIRIKIADIEDNMLTAPESLIKKRYTPALEKLYQAVKEWSD